MKKTLFTIMVIALFSGCSTTSTFLSLDTRYSEKQNILIEGPKDQESKGTILLFVGGHGNVELSKNGIGWGKNNFVARTKSYWHEAGYQTVMVDAPSDFKDGHGMLYGFRNSTEHYKDILTVVEKLDNSKPIWLNGTSRGTESVAYLAIKLKDKIDGIILTSSITRTTDKGNSILTLKLDQIKVPAFIASHRQDECWTTPPEDLFELERKLSNSKAVLKKFYNNGYNELNNACKAKTYHGFLGMEEEILTDMVNFVNTNSQ